MLAIVERLAGAAEACAGAARRRRPPHRAHVVPHRRRGAPHRRRQLAAVARSRATSARCSSSGSRRSPTRSIPASASTWRGCRCWWRSRPRPSRLALAAREDQAELDRLVDRLSARLGRAPRAPAGGAGQPYSGARRGLACRRRRRADPGWEAFRRHRAEADLAPRPLRLLTRPEPIEAVAEVPDGPPLRFRWRRALHEVIAAEGPERIEGAWWSEHGGPARAIISASRTKRACASGCFAPGSTAISTRRARRRAPTWFLHGMFA